MSANPVPIALVGLGAVAESHLAAYRALPEVKIVAVVDPREARTHEVAARIGARGFTSCEEMLAQLRPTIGCVLSTVASHRTVTETLAAAGVHVLCEKPMATRMEDALAMRTACQLHSVQLMYGSSYRFLPAIIKARELIASGAIGRVRLIEERDVSGSGASHFTPMSSAHYPEGTPGGGGSGLVDHGVHLMDIFPWLIGSPIRSVLGRGNYTGQSMGVEFAILEHDCGALGTLTYDESTVSSDLPWEGVFSEGRGWRDGLGFAGERGEWTPGAGCIRVHGTEGALRLFHYANRLFLCLPGEVRQIDVQGSAAPEHFGQQLRSFIQALGEGKPAPLSADVGIDALSTLLAVYRSARVGSWVDIERNGES